MCGRYLFTDELKEKIRKELAEAALPEKNDVWDAFEEEAPEENAGSARKRDITPGMRPPVITGRGIRGIKADGGTGTAGNSIAVSGMLQIEKMRWGIPARKRTEVPAGQKQAGRPQYPPEETSPGRLIINARCESVLDRPMFRDIIRENRCVIPAAAFYEWDREKTRVTFRRQDGTGLYLAGFYDREDRFVILTGAAKASVLPVHERMPLILEPEEVRDWIGDGRRICEYLHKDMPQLQSSREYEQLRLF